MYKHNYNYNFKLLCVGGNGVVALVCVFVCVSSFFLFQFFIQCTVVLYYNIIVIISCTLDGNLSIHRDQGGAGLWGSAPCISGQIPSWFQQSAGQLWCETCPVLEPGWNPAAESARLPAQISGSIHANHAFSGLCTGFSLSVFLFLSLSRSLFLQSLYETNAFTREGTHVCLIRTLHLICTVCVLDHWGCSVEVL